jgi:hypothetical protein
MNRRTIAIAVAGALAVVLAAVFAVRSLRPESRYEPAPADAARPAPDRARVDAVPAVPPPAARVASVSGTVRVRRAGVERDVAADTELEADDILTTGEDGRAVVRVDDENTVVLEAGTTVTWGTISESISSVQLDRGFLSASTGEAGGRVFRIQALDRTAQVESTAGAFDVAGDRERLEVGASSGSVAVQSGGETVRVEAGSYTTVRRGERPQVPRQLPGDVVAEIFWPGEQQAETGDRLIADRSVVVRGRLSDGLSGVLTIRNERTGQTYRVTTHADGSFEAQVALAEDQPNALVVGGAAIGGRPVGEQRAIVVQDSTPPPLTVRIQ